MTKGKEKRPRKRKDLGSQLHTTPWGWSHLSPPALTKLVPSSHQQAGSTPGSSTTSPKPAAPSPPPSALPGTLTLAGSLLWALSRLDSGHCVQGHSILYNVPEREVAPLGRWSSSALAGPILPKASPCTSKGLQD